MLAASSASNPVEVNWSAVAVGLVVIAAAGRSVVRSFKAPAIMYSNFKDAPERTRAVIEAEKVLPELASLIDEVNDQALVSGSGSVEDSLIAVDYLERLRRLSDYYGDYRDTSRLVSESEKWSRWKGLSALVFMSGFALLWTNVSVDGVTFPAWPMVMGGILLLVGLTVWIVAGLQEIALVNRLAEILRRYGQS